MPTITDFNDVEFVDVYAMKLDRPSVIVSKLIIRFILIVVCEYTYSP